MKWIKYIYIFLLTISIAQAQRHSYDNYSKGTYVSRWYNLGFASNKFQDVNAFTWSTHLFPDTAVVFESQGKFNRAVYHSIATILDPTHIFFDKSNIPNEKLYVYDNTSYTFDSIGIYYSYFRNLEGNTPDTLIIQAFAINANYKYSRWTGATAAKFGVDTLELINIKYNSATQLANLDNVTTQTFKILLTPDDVNTNRKDVFVNNIAVNADRWIGVAIFFKPGYSYSDGNLASNLNTFYFNSWEELGPNSNDYPTYLKKDWNCSYIANNQTYYNTTDSWYGYYIPSYLMSNTFNLEHHDIDFHISAEINEGINDQPQNNDFSFTIFPNPTKNNIYIQTNNFTKELTWKIYSITGKLIEQGILDYSNQVLSTKQLEAGLYYISLTHQEMCVTKPIVILK